MSGFLYVFIILVCIMSIAHLTYLSKIVMTKYKCQYCGLKFRDNTPFLGGEVIIKDYCSAECTLKHRKGKPMIMFVGQAYYR